MSGHGKRPAPKPGERFRYKKEMGQHFIFDPALIETLAEASCVTRDDGVLEIGPGRGTLTAALARRARYVLAVELDRTLLRGLETSMALYPNVEIMEGDILRQDFHALAARLGTPCRLAANLPYNITTPLLERLLLEKLPFASLAIMVQQEVGARMMAGPGMEGYGPLSLLVQYFTDVCEAVPVPAACFTPPPKVDSSFMLMTPHAEPPVHVLSESFFFTVVRVAFTMRRKTILNNAMGGLGLSRETAMAALEAANIPPQLRAEQMDMAALARLSDELHKLRTEA